MEFRKYLKEVDALGGMGFGGMGIPGQLSGGALPIPGGMPMPGGAGMKPPMGGGAIPPPMPGLGNAQPNGMGGQQAPQLQPLKIQSKDVWSVLEKLLNKSKTSDVRDNKSSNIDNAKDNSVQRSALASS